MRLTSDWAQVGRWFIGLGLAGALWLGGIGLTPLTLPLDVLYRTEPVGEIHRSQTAGQTFLAPYAGLRAISVSLADYGRRNTGPLTFTLKPAPESPNVLVFQSLAAEAVQGDVVQTFSFEPLADSAGRQFYFELAAPQANPGNALTAYIQPQGDYADGQAYWAGAPRAGDLVFELRFQVPVWERVWIWFQQVTAGKPGLLSQGWYYLLLGLAGLGLAGWLFNQAGADG